ncbi:MAG: ABC transporter ATP-binding protein [Candidatus Bathyarchaeia archaeon]|jgi:peptide/nickel transport system ATP-binding protein
MPQILKIESLSTYFFTEAGTVKAVDGVAFGLEEGETLGVVGESGSGKTVTALSILGIVQRPGRIVHGRILYKGENLLEMSEEQRRKLRGKDLAYIMQDPTTSLDPVYNIESQLTEVLRAHTFVSKKEARERVLDFLRTVGISDPEKRLQEYPHTLSTGMRQRVAIARAILCSPHVLLADEPTTALDVTVQAQILKLMKDLKNKFNMSMMLITHDMGIIAKMSDRVCVMYAGRMCEIADVKTIYKKPRHPYTEALLSSMPRIDTKRGTLTVIPGGVPDLINPPSGCRFHPRCKYAKEVCKEIVPEPEEIEPGHFVECLRVRELGLD